MKHDAELRCKFCKLMMLTICQTSIGTHFWCGYCGAICFCPKLNTSDKEWSRCVLNAFQFRGD